MRWRGFILALICAGAASFGTAGTASAGVPDATMRGAFAVAPPSAPPAVKAMIQAANRIRHKPYVWGGGHVSWWSRGYDCSGSVSYVLHAGGLLDYPQVAKQFKSYGEGGKGAWVTLYASNQHVYAVIAGLRWDTSFITDGDRSGPGWSETMRPYSHRFKIRHPVGVGHAQPLG